MAFDDTETQLGVNNVQDAIVEQNKNFSKTFIQSGVVSKDEIVGKSVVFPVRYKTTPRIIASWATTESNASGTLPVIKISIIKTDSFYITYGGNVVDNVTDVCWIAVGEV